MTTTPMKLQDLRRRIYAKAKAEPSWRFWGLYVHICKPEVLHEAYQLAKANNGAPELTASPLKPLRPAGLMRFDRYGTNWPPARIAPCGYGTRRFPRKGERRPRAVDSDDP